MVGSKKMFAAGLLFAAVVGLGNAGALGSGTRVGGSCTYNFNSNNGGTSTVNGIAWTQRSGLTSDCLALAARWRNGTATDTWRYMYKSGSTQPGIAVSSRGLNNTITGGSHKVLANNNSWYGNES
jgi:hypothetical protein